METSWIGVVFDSFAFLDLYNLSTLESCVAFLDLYNLSTLESCVFLCGGSIYLIFVIFLHKHNFWLNFSPHKSV